MRTHPIQIAALAICAQAAILPVGKQSTKLPITVPRGATGTKTIATVAVPTGASPSQGLASLGLTAAGQCGAACPEEAANGGLVYGTVQFCIQLGECLRTSCPQSLLSADALAAAFSQVSCSYNGVLGGGSTNPSPSSNGNQAGGAEIPSVTTTSTVPSNNDNANSNGGGGSINGNGNTVPSDDADPTTNPSTAANGGTKGNGLAIGNLLTAGIPNDNLLGTGTVLTAAAPTGATPSQGVATASLIADGQCGALCPQYAVQANLLNSAVSTCDNFGLCLAASCPASVLNVNALASVFNEVSCTYSGTLAPAGLNVPSLSLPTGTSAGAANGGLARASAGLPLTNKVALASGGLATVAVPAGASPSSGLLTASVFSTGQCGATCPTIATQLYAANLAASVCVGLEVCLTQQCPLLTPSALVQALQGQQCNVALPSATAAVSSPIGAGSGVTITLPFFTTTLAVPSVVGGAPAGASSPFVAGASPTSAATPSSCAQGCINTAVQLQMLDPLLNVCLELGSCLTNQCPLLSAQSVITILDAQQCDVTVVSSASSPAATASSPGNQGGSSPPSGDPPMTQPPNTPTSSPEAPSTSTGGRGRDPQSSSKHVTETGPSTTSQSANKSQHGQGVSTPQSTSGIGDSSKGTDGSNTSSGSNSPIQSEGSTGSNDSTGSNGYGLIGTGSTQSNGYPAVTGSSSQLDWKAGTTLMFVMFTICVRICSPSY